MDKEELRDIIYLDDRIESKLRQLESLRSTKDCIGSIDYSKDRVQVSTVSSGIENVIIRIVDLESDINSDIDRLVDMKQKAREEINKVNGMAGTILEMRYLENMKWEEIAYRLNYSIRAVYKIHGQALEVIRDIQSVQ